MKFVQTILVYMMLIHCDSANGQTENKTDWLDFRKTETLNQLNPISNDSSLPAIEKDLREYPQIYIKYHFGNREYDCNKIIEFLDSCFQYIRTESLPNQNKPNYEMYEFRKDFKDIMDAIDSLPKSIDFYNDAKTESIKRSILELNPSPIKVRALLYFGGHFFLKNDSLGLMNYFYSQAKEVSNKEKNIFNWAKCEEEIGDFFTRYTKLPTGLTSYFNCLQLYDSLERYHDLARISRKIAFLYEQRDNLSYWEKAEGYYVTAARLYSDEKDSINSYKAYLYAIRTRLKCTWDINYSHNLNLTLKDVAEWLDYIMFVYQKDVLKYKELTKYLYTSIGDYFSRLKGTTNFKLALLYYQASLATQIINIKDFNYSFFYQNLYSVAWHNAILKNEKEALKFSDYHLYISGRENNPYSFHWGILNKANILNLLSRYDEALNHIEGGLSLSEIKQPLEIEINEFNRWGYRIKSWIFQNMKLYDSVNVYEGKYELTKSAFIIELANLTNIETTALVNIQNRHFAKIENEYNLIIKKKDMSIKEKENALELVSKLIRLKEDSLSSFSLLLQVLKQDSILKKQEILKLDTARTKLLNDNKFLNIENEEKKRTLLWIFPIAALIISTLIVLGFYYYFRNKRLTDENAVAQLKVSNQQLKNHEFKELSAIIKTNTSSVLSSVQKNGFYEGSQEFEKLKSLDKLTGMVDKYIYQYYKSSKETTNSINDELELAKLYTDIFKMKYELNTESIRLEDLVSDDFIKNKIQVPTHLINNFIINSIKHGLQGQDSICVSIEAVTTRTGYKIIIEDNGCGINRSKSNKPHSKEVGTGIQLAIDSADAYNRNVNNDFNIIFSENNIVDKAATNKGKGTQVTIEFLNKTV